MKENTFEWSESSQLSVPVLLLAVFGPSAFAFSGFHGVLPLLVSKGMPAILAWPLVAGVMLFLFSFLALYLLIRESRTMGIPLTNRLCLKPVPVRSWFLYVVLAVAMMVVVSLIQPLLPVIWKSLGIRVPDYMPFFLKGVDPATTPLDQLTPGFDLRGAYWTLPFMGVVLFLNIVVEDLYFRAWLLPKMSRFGSMSWVYNGILFAMYHTFQLWLLPVLLMASLLFAFTVWHSRSIWPSLALHFVLNLLFGLLGMLTIVLRDAV